MTEHIQGDFLRKRMIELRENGKSQSEMADLLFVNKSLSRVEKGETAYKSILSTQIDTVIFCLQRIKEVVPWHGLLLQTPRPC